MSPDVDATPLPDGLPTLSPGALVFDTIYNPDRDEAAPQQAKAAGARTVNGEPMFLRQAAVQFETWTSQPAPLDAMREAFRNAL